MTDPIISGSITTQNLVPAGIATAGSAVEIDCNNMSTLTIQTVGTYTGALTLQGTLDGTNWVSFGGTPLLNANTGGYLATITSALQAIFQADVSGFKRVRVSANAAVTGTVVVTLIATQSTAMIALDAPLPTGANTIGAVTGTVAVTQPTTTVLAISLNSAATTNATSTKATAGSLFEISASNQTASTKYLKLYNKASAPTVGTDVPVVTIPIPANGEVAREYGANGKRFTTGIAYALTGAQAIADTTALAAGDVQVHGSYI